jgi:hypothetical protein
MKKPQARTASADFDEFWEDQTESALVREEPAQRRRDRSSIWKNAQRASARRSTQALTLRHWNFDIPSSFVIRASHSTMELSPASPLRGCVNEHRTPV